MEMANLSHDENEVNEKEQETYNQRDIFVKKYSVEIQFPAYYYADARFVPHHDDLIVDMSYHIIPMGSHHEV